MAKKLKEPNELVGNATIADIIKASGNQYADTAENSEVLNNKDSFSTQIYGMNIGLGGELTGAMTCGCLQLVGDTMTFKTLFMLVLAKSYLDKYDDAKFILFDSEHGSAKEYFDSVGIDPARVVHCPIVSVEDLRGQANKIMDILKRDQRIFFGVDSIGLLASNKEINDAISGNEAADMTRAKALNSFFRTIVSKLPVLNMPMVIVNHSYADMKGPYAPDIIKGGKNSVLAADTIWTITRANDRETGGDKELKGFKFTITIHKSRKARQRSQIPIMVSFEHGINKYSGLQDIAEEGGFITSPSQGKLEYNGQTCKTADDDTINSWLEELVHNEEFADYIRDTYKQVGKKLIQG